MPQTAVHVRRIQGWTVDEQISFSQKRLKFSRMHPVRFFFFFYIYGLRTCLLQLLFQGFLKRKPNPVRPFAYVNLPENDNG